ncbi:GFA family protein [Methylovirgula sp. 4M-Z18]|uniref:GFA family protein n=1 Tax=Methylovirgula sp. 4M-Z18 TaxID=2293567 RepID=UPI000E2EE0D3|nr:GFA family protein [Methylovirgula sp. 4M-Z18]RFB78925.1 GFA family protein [Methylovirgula sp. 4M-Z18]
MTDHALTGGCQCGLVRFACMAEPHRVSVCHCRMCQKAMGNVFGIFAGFATRDVRWTRDTPARFQSSEAGERGFCNACGTPLYYKVIDEGGIWLTVGSFDTPEHFPPVSASGVQSKLPWADALHELPGRNTIIQARFASRQHPDHDT